MEWTQEVVVKVVSRETVKPSIPTPTHLKTFTLSYVDQILPLVPPFLTTGLVFYTAPPETQLLDITRLKASLSKTLSRFYPLAGRVEESTIVCNDEGIPFIETHVNCALSTFLNLPHKLDLVTKFLPPRTSLGLGVEPITKLVHLAIQVSVFECGGVAIGWYDIHKVMDGTSSATFFKHWAGLASQHYEDLIQPDFDATVTTFPPSSQAIQLQFDNGYEGHVQSSPTVIRSFIFKSAAISDLKAMAASELVPNPTSYLALAGYIWEQVVAAKRAANGLGGEEGSSDTILQVTLDLRPRMNPQLPKGSMGNLVNTAVARAHNRIRMPELVTEIHDAVCKLKKSIIGYQRETAVEDVRDNWNTLIDILSDYQDRAYKLVSWCKLGFSELNFGFGKPKWMVPTDGKVSPFHRNLIILIDHKDLHGDGIEAWFFLDVKEMEVLESRKEFLAYASPVH